MSRILGKVARSLADSPVHKTVAGSPFIGDEFFSRSISDNVSPAGDIIINNVLFGNCTQARTRRFKLRDDLLLFLGEWSICHDNYVLHYVGDSSGCLRGSPQESVRFTFKVNRHQKITR
nr:Orf2 [Nostoc sp. PCC 7524]